MANETIVFPVFVYFTTVLLSVPLSLVAYVLSGRRESFTEALITVGVGMAAVVLAVVTVTALTISPLLGGYLLVLAGAATLVLAAFPFYIGRSLLADWTGLSPDAALEYATVAWPVGLVVSLLVFLIPGVTAETTILSLSGVIAAVAWAAFGAVVTLGPAVAGLGMYRLVERTG